MRHFKLFYRIGCHLCEDMLLLLHPYESSGQISLETINVDKTPELQKKYGLLIPVLCDADENEICHYFFDKFAFERSLGD